MKTLNVSPAEMERRIARFSKLTPQKGEYEKRGIPTAAFEMLTAKSIYMLMAPPGDKGMTAGTPVAGDAGLTVSIVKCPPGNGPKLHAHMRTQESFMALTGRWEVRWGDDGEHAAVLDPFDFIAVPAGVGRQFTNLDNAEALLFVLVRGDEALNDIYYSPRMGDEIAQRFGPEVRQSFERIGFSFELGV